MDLKPLQAGTPRPIPTVAARDIPALIESWRVGDILQATVIGRGERGSLLLNVQGALLEATRPPLLPFRAGERLPVQILAREPRLELRLLAPPTQAIDPARLQQALRETLPRQLPLPPLLANLALIQRQGENLPLPREVLPLLRDLWSSLASRESLNQPLRLAQALRASGPFLEAALAASLRGEGARPGTDLRGQLLRLAAALQRHLPTPPPAPTRLPASDYPALRNVPATPSPPRAPANPWAASGAATHLRHHDVVRGTPVAQPPASSSLATATLPETAVPDFLRQVEGAIARIHSHALHALHAQAEGRPLWAMELPIRHDGGVDLFDLRIEEETRQLDAPAHARRWSVRLAFELEGLGPVTAIISLQNEAVATRFWAEHADTARLFAHWLETLGSRLRQAGLNVGALECRCGPAPDDGGEPPPLLREEA